MRPRPLFRLLAAGLVLFAACRLDAQQATDAGTEMRRLQDAFSSTHQGVIRTYCVTCHSAAEKQGELDLERFTSVAEMRRDAAAWQRVLEMLDTGEMPPEDADKPTGPAAGAARLGAATFSIRWRRPAPAIRARRAAAAEQRRVYLHDPGPDRRCRFEPAREFPADSAAGEGFTNVGSALAMSPAMLEKYLDAAKEIAGHAVLLPHGIEFSPGTSPRDWTDEKLAAIRAFYDRYSDSGGATAVNLQGIQLETNGGGRLPLEKYLRATLEERDALQSGTVTIAEVAPPGA
jgi:hypothetical protein